MPAIAIPTTTASTKKTGGLAEFTIRAKIIGPRKTGEAWTIKTLKTINDALLEECIPSYQSSEEIVLANVSLASYTFIVDLDSGTNSDLVGKSQYSTTIAYLFRSHYSGIPIEQHFRKEAVNINAALIYFNI